jgi:Arc/MetJ family transcription regulator
MARKTTLDLNEELLAQAQQVLGTTGIKDTVDGALREVVVADARRKYIEYLKNLEVDADDLRREAWGL